MPHYMSRRTAASVYLRRKAYQRHVRMQFMRWLVTDAVTLIALGVIGWGLMEVIAYGLR